jgi:curved DNA-binding protein
MTARASSALSLQAARAILGVASGADERELRAAYREAAKHAHPDRPGGDAALFRDVLAAYRLLQDNPIQPIHFPPAVAQPARVEQAVLTIDAAMAFAGGTLELKVDARMLRLTLPAGLREGDKVRVEDVVFRVAFTTDPEALPRGDDLWLTARLSSRALAEGGRVEVATVLGPRLVWISTKAAARGLVRLPGQGLPARGPHRQGDLFLRLEAVDGEAESAARSQLKRFAAAWAA